MDKLKHYMVNEGIEVSYDHENHMYFVSNEKGEYMASENKPTIGCKAHEESICYHEPELNRIKCWKKKDFP